MAQPPLSIRPSVGKGCPIRLTIRLVGHKSRFAFLSQHKVERVAKIENRAWPNTVVIELDGFNPLHDQLGPGQA